ncbi:MAG: nucleoside triphosphate pyrophosphohydrolase [Pseudomonadota bacterium]
MTAAPTSALDRLNNVLARLLDPGQGCPWDLKQTPRSVKMYILEETYELLDAVDAGSSEGVREELGDCLFLLLFMARIFPKDPDFTFDDVINGAAQKLISRHPHVFGEGPSLADAEEVKGQWARLKRQEKKGSILAGVPGNLPSLLRAHRLTERAGRCGFDWEGPEQVLSSLGAELEELKQALDREPERAEDELGDVFFTLVNLARHLKINAEDSLRRANDRFEKRFQFIEGELEAQGVSLDDASLKRMDELWAAAKKKGL